jgi:hypothetical protein
VKKVKKNLTSWVLTVTGHPFRLRASEILQSSTVVFLLSVLLSSYYYLVRVQLRQNGFTGQLVLLFLSSMS